MLLKRGKEISGENHDQTICINGQWLRGRWPIVKFQLSHLQARKL